MQIDTDGIVGWENKTIVLEFCHLKEDIAVTDKNELWLSRKTMAKLSEFSAVRPSCVVNMAWHEVKSGWKRPVAWGIARCSPEDAYCKETGRRVALRWMIRVFTENLPAIKQQDPNLSIIGPSWPAPKELVARAINQYHKERAQLRARRLVLTGERSLNRR